MDRKEEEDMNKESGCRAKTRNVRTGRMTGCEDKETLVQEVNVIVRPKRGGITLFPISYRVLCTE